MPCVIVSSAVPHRHGGIRARLEAIGKRLRHLEAQKDSLTVRAKHNGRWIAPDLDHAFGAWLPRGTALGQVVNADSFYFSAIVSEKEAARLFNGTIRSAEVRLRGQAGLVVPVLSEKIIPAEHQVLPSAALGWRGGGEIPVELNDESGLRTAEPFFEVRASVANSQAAILHGRSGKIRFQLPPEPLLEQWIRKLRQLLQQRYAIG